MHDRAGCTLKTRNPEGICMGCEMDLLFTQVFSGSRVPYNPHHLLYVTWKYANSLAGYEQQVPFSDVKPRTAHPPCV